MSLLAGRVAVLLASDLSSDPAGTALEVTGGRFI